MSLLTIPRVGEMYCPRSDRTAAKYAVGVKSDTEALGVSVRRVSSIAESTTEVCWTC